MPRSLLLIGIVVAALLTAVLICNGFIGDVGIRHQFALPPRRIDDHEIINGRVDHQEQQQQQQQQHGGGKILNTTPGIVELSFMGRMGNNLFEYAVARTLAEKLDWALSLKAFLNKDKFKALLKPRGQACFPGVRPLAPPISSPEMAKLRQVYFRGVKKELADATPRKIIMQDWFQEYDLFASEKDRVREILAINPSCCGPTAPGPNDMVIHYRNYKSELSDEQYKKLHFKDLDFKFYNEVIDTAQEKPETVWVVGEFEKDNPLVKRLQEEYDNVKIAEMVADQFNAFCFLTRAPRLVMAHSTFSWWAAFLGNATEVHFPFQSTRMGVTGPQIVVSDEPRYIYRDDNGLVMRPFLR